MKISMDAAMRGAPTGKSIDAAKILLEEMASSNYKWSSKRATPKRSGGRYEVDVVTLLADRVDALTHRLDKAGTPSPVGVCAACETCGV